MRTLTLLTLIWSGTLLWVGCEPSDSATNAQVSNAVQIAQVPSKPTPIPSPVERAKLMVKKGKVEGAIALLKGELAKRDDDIDLHRAYQDAMRAAKKGQEALLEYAERVQKQPNSPVAHYLHGRSLIASAPEEAAKAFRKSITLDPNFEWSYLGLGVTQAQAGNHFDASQTYEKALERFPKSAFLYLNLADARFQMKALRSALEAVEKAQKLKPDLAEAYQLEGFIKYEQRDVDGAYAALMMALSKNPNLGRSHVVLADILADRRDLAGAKKHADQAAALGAEISTKLKMKLE